LSIGFAGRADLILDRPLQSGTLYDAGWKLRAQEIPDWNRTHTDQVLLEPTDIFDE
jgi:hypothetical protein